MCSLNEMFGPKGSSLIVPTYNVHEAGGLDLSYRIEMTVIASLRNASAQKQDRLISYMKSLGYSTCEIDTRNNTIKIDSITGVNPAEVMRYIRKHIDKHASEQR